MKFLDSSFLFKYSNSVPKSFCDRFHTSIARVIGNAGMFKQADRFHFVPLSEVAEFDERIAALNGNRPDRRVAFMLPEAGRKNDPRFARRVEKIGKNGVFALEGLGIEILARDVFNEAEKR